MGWALAPLVWGIFSWLVWHNTIVTSFPFRLLILTSGASIIVIRCFGSFFQKALHQRLYFLNYSIPLLPWWAFLLFVWIGVFTCLTPLCDYPIISAVTQGILVYSILEEFITRSFFIRYRMRMVEFFILNALSALSFSLMHCFYGESLLQALTVGHFGFSFILSCIVYKTNRIELTILLHMLANIVNYTLPCVILHNSFPIIVGVAKLTFELLFFVTFIGCAFKEKVLK